MPNQSNNNLSGTNFGGIPQKSSKQGNQKGVLQKCPQGQSQKAATTIGGMPRGQPRKGGRRPRENEVKYFDGGLGQFYRNFLLIIYLAEKTENSKRI